MGSGSVITSQMHDAIGAGSAPAPHQVEAGAIRRFAEAVGDFNPLYRDERAAGAARYGGIVAPPTFMRTMRPSPAVPEFEVPYAGVLDAGSRWHFSRPVVAGDTISVTTRLVDLYERTGKLGNMLFAVRENTFVNQDGETAVVERDTEIYYDGRAGAPPRSRETSRSATPAEAVSLGAPRFEDVAVGIELPTLVKRPSLRQLVMYAGASGDFCELHYDRDFARARGFDEVIVHGALKSAFLGQLVTEWAGHPAALKELAIQYRGIDFPDAPLSCKGLVTERRPAGEERLVRCDVWIENELGERTTKGTALVALPRLEI